jgi:hypothetical protein
VTIALARLWAAEALLRVSDACLRLAGRLLGGGGRRPGLLRVRATRAIMSGLLATSVAVTSMARRVVPA